MLGNASSANVADYICMRRQGYQTEVEWPYMLYACFPMTRSRATANADIGSIERNASEGSWL